MPAAGSWATVSPAVWGDVAGDTAGTKNPVQDTNLFQATQGASVSALGSRNASAIRSFVRVRLAGPPVDFTPALVGYVAGLGAVAACVALFTVRPNHDALTLCVLAAAVFALASTSVRMIPGVDMLFNTSMLVSIGLAIVLGPIGAAVGALAEGIGVLLRWGTGWFRGVFNVSTNFLASIAAWGCFFGITHTNLDTRLALSLAGLAAGTAHYVVNYFTLSAVVSISTGQPFFERLRSSMVSSAYSLLYGWGVVPFVIVHEHFGAIGVAWLLAPIVATQALLILFATRVRTHNEQKTQLLETIQEAHARVERSYDATLVALTHALDARDKETEGHSRRVVEYSREVARALGMTEAEVTLLAHGALLHDIGKIGVPDAILHKPGPLTDEEWDIMRRHPEIGAAMVQDIEVLKEARLIILHHHERWDGRGYPLGLSGKRITLGARIFAIADTVDAMTQDRPYRLAVSLDEAREEVLRHRGRQFDPEAVDAFLSLPERRLVAIQRSRTPVGIDLLERHADQTRGYLASNGLGTTALRRRATPAGAAAHGSHPLATRS